MSYNADNNDVITGGGNGSITTMATTISTLQALTSPSDLQGVKDIADVVFSWQNEKNRKGGSLCLMPTGAQNIYGGSITTQVQVGAKQF